MAIDLSKLEFGADFQKDQVYNFRVTFVQAKETKKKDKIRVSVGCEVINGPCTGNRVYFAAYDFVAHTTNPADQMTTWIRFLNDCAKITGEDPQYLKTLKEDGKGAIPTEDNEQTPLLARLLNSCFQATVTWNPPQGEYDGSWQLAVKNVKGPVPDDVLYEANPMAELLED